jgi:enoyl-CoA hydratase/carnithine racemase
MSAIAQIPQYFTTEFTSNWEHLLQQKVSKLRELVSVESVRGKEKTFNQMAAVEMTKITSRAADTNISDVALAKRWLRPYPYEHATLFDEWDAEYLGEVSLPQSETVNNHAMAYMRTCDKVIIDAALGNAYTGETGVTATALPAGQKVAVDYVETGSTANSGLTIAKLRQAAYLLTEAEVDDSDPRIIVVSAKQVQDLLRTTEVTSADYNTVKALVNGDIVAWLNSDDTYLPGALARVEAAFAADPSLDFVYGDAFFDVEYQLDALIHRYPKPFVTWAHGVDMGGGVGLSVAGSERVVTEGLKLAMPEIHIGLFPDVGGGWFLNRVPGEAGLLLAMTGAIVNEADALYARLADHAIAHARQPAERWHEQDNTKPVAAIHHCGGSV